MADTQRERDGDLGQQVTLRLMCAFFVFSTVKDSICFEVTEHQRPWCTDVFLGIPYAELLG